MASRETQRFAHFDRYELLEKVGEGGFGTVYRARHRFLEQICALKVLPPALGSDEEAMARFEREVRALRSLDHPNVVRVQDAGIEERTGSPYLAMTFVEGETLQAYIERKAPLPVDEVVRLGRQMAEALHHVHTHDPDYVLVHRDVKPSNIIVTPDGRAVLTDFGIAFSDALPRISREVIGTPVFMSPEQTDGRPVDGRSDLYGLGVVLYECLTGELPFEEKGDSPAATARLIHRILNEPPGPVSSHRDDVPEWLDAIVQRCLAKRPEDRYPSGAALAEALRTGEAGTVESAEAASIVARRTTRKSPRGPSAAPSPPAAKKRAGISSKRFGLMGRKRVLIAAAVLVLMVAALAFDRFTGEASNTSQADHIRVLLAEGEAALVDDRLTTPKGHAAFDRVQDVLALDPDNRAARRLRERIVERYEAWGDAAEAAGEYVTALDYYDRALTVAADTSQALLAKHDAMREALAPNDEAARSSNPVARGQERGKAKGRKEELGW